MPRMAPVTVNPLWQCLNQALALSARQGTLSETSAASLQQMIQSSGGSFQLLPPHALSCVRDVIQRAERNADITKLFGRGRLGEARFQGLKSLISDIVLKAPVSAAPPPTAEAPGLELYEHQSELVQDVLTAMRANLDPKIAWDPSSPKDRGYAITPPQTGKTTAVSVLSNEARHLFQGKQVLFLSVSDVVAKNVLDDTARFFKGRVTRVDAEEKDISGDLVVASIFTLVKMLGDPSLNDRFGRDRFGLVIIDEMTFMLTPTCLKIAAWLGFADPAGRMTPAPGKFLLGLGATARRGDARHLNEIFGTRELFHRSVTYFEERGLYHPFDGLDLTYSAAPNDWALVEEEDETILTMRDNDRNNRKIVEEYRKHLDGKKTIVWCSTQDHAHNLAKAFNKELGDGYAAAVTARLEPKAATRILEDFNEGTGPKIVIGVKKFGLSFRANNTEGVLFTYLSTSYNDFIQKASRPLARKKGEDPHEVLIITVRPEDVPFTRGHTAASLYGLRFAPSNRKYSPRRAREEGAQKLEGVDDDASLDEGKLGYMKIIRRQRLKLRLESLEFGPVWKSIAKERFGDDPKKMAEHLGLSPAQCRSYAEGHSPENYPEALCAIGRKLGVQDFQKLSQAWLNDHLRLVEMAYPFREDAKPELIALSRLVRKAVILQSRGSLHEFFKIEEGNESRYHAIVSAFQGRAIRSLPEVAYFILNAGAADEATVRELLGRFQETKKSGGSAAPIASFYRDDPEGSDPAYIDALAFKKARSLSFRRESSLRDAADILGFPLPGTPEDQLAEREWNGRYEKVLSDFLSQSSLMGARIMQMRFGLNGDEPKTLEEVGDELGLSKERVRQIQNRSLHRLRQHLKDAGILDTAPQV